MNQGIPYGFLIFCSVILACVITVRQALREERQEKKALEKEREDYMKRKIEKELAEQREVMKNHSKKNDDSIEE